MFTTEQIKAAHSKVKSGADFPAYIREIKELGVTGYECWINDGHVDYFGADNYVASAPPKSSAIAIADIANSVQFVAGLKAHQAGQTDYPTFVAMCAATGIIKWRTDLTAMTCTYYDKAGNTVLVERIPDSI